MRPTALGRAAEDYLMWLSSHGYAQTTVANRRHHLDELVEFLAERDMAEPRAVSFSALESYQRHLFHHKKRDGAPLSFRTQAQRIIGAKGFFSWMTSHGLIALDPASGIVLPKAEHRLPEATLSAEEADAVLSGPDVTTALGLRDRAVMEVLYSTAIRRAELIALKLWDIDHERGTVFVRQGKGGRDRYTPIGPRALSWVDRYLELVRPRLVVDKTDTLFLAVSGAPLCADWLSRTVTAYISAGAPQKARQLPHVPPHGGDTHVGRRGRHQIRGRDARPCQVGDDRHLHPGLDRKAAGGARRHPSGGRHQHRGEQWLATIRL